MNQPISDHHVEFAKDDKGNEVAFRFIFTTKQPISPMKSELTKGISKAQDMLDAIMNVAGIDLIQPVGRYSIEVVVAKTYDPKQVVEALVEAIRPVQSGILVATFIK
jgi:hypothetical protein